MNDVRPKLSAKFSNENRFSNFGPVIVSADISGFRGLHTSIEFEFPVTALTGFNGSGKSTIGQLLLCAYKRIGTAINSKRYYVKDFFPVSVADPAPFTQDASITYRYQTDKIDSHQDLTVRRAKKEWSGYSRQPERNTEYVGFTVYIPKVERRDLSIYGAKNLLLTSAFEVENASTYVSRILGAAYDKIYFQGVAAKSRSGELGVASRFGYSYSENNMGFGEGRLVYMVRLLETCPEQSFIVLEEPETSLHESAQYEFAKYLMDVANRRRHQIVFSTHSSVMMDALPPEGRKLLIRSANGVDIFDRISSSRIRTALSAGEGGHTIICVEDTFAQSMLREILRRYDLGLLETVEVLPFGDARSVVEAKKVLERAGKKSIAVRDADQPAIPKENVLSLPGSKAPEMEVFLSDAVQEEINSQYGFDFKAFLAGNPELDHHNYSAEISKRKNCSREVVESDSIRSFLDQKGDIWSRSLCEEIKRRV